MVNVNYIFNERERKKERVSFEMMDWCRATKKMLP